MRPPAAGIPGPDPRDRKITELERQLAAARQRWLPVAPNVTGFFHDLGIPQWHLKVRVMIYRKHVAHESPKNFQLDLFTPDDGHFEYAAVATNMAVDLPALHAFICGRGEHLPAVKTALVVDAAGAGDWCSAGFVFKLGLGGLRSLR